MMNLVKKTLPFIIFVGTLLIVFGIANLNNLTVIESKSINYTAQYTWNFYTFNVGKYLQNLETSIKPQQLLQAMPEKPTTINYNNEILKNILRSIIFVLNWLIYITNWVLLFPLKLILYPVNIIFAIIGINTSDQEVIKGLIQIYNFNIPLIPNI